MPACRRAAAAHAAAAVDIMSHLCHRPRLEALASLEEIANNHLKKRPIHLRGAAIHDVKNEQVISPQPLRLSGPRPGSRTWTAAVGENSGQSASALAPAGGHTLSG